MRRRKKTKNTYAFIDSQNLNLGTQRMGWKMDWRKFRQYLKDKHGVTQAFMFIGYMSEHEAIYEYMHELGFLVVLKPTLEVSGKPAPQAAAPKETVEEEVKTTKKEDKPAVKGNVDAELVLYAMKELPNYDQAIIVSGDGDFFSLIEYLEQKGKLASILTPNWQYSTLLKQFENKIIRLDTLRKDLAYHDRKKK